MYGIVTDGMTWIYFVVKPYSTFHRAHRVLRFEIMEEIKEKGGPTKLVMKKEQQDLVLASLKRSRRSTIKHFFQFLDAVHADLTLQKFESKMNLALSERVKGFAAEARKKGVRVSAKDEVFLMTMYNGACLPVKSIEMLTPEEPVRITRH